jgi:hypothetical protein
MSAKTLPVILVPAQELAHRLRMGAAGRRG